MFGYVRTDFPNLYIKDSVLYRALYCGLCKGIGGTCGQCGRLALDYDLTFLSAFFHNLTGKDVVIKKKRCLVHPFIPHETAERDDLTDKIACLNVILAYHKLNDDVLDSGKGRFKRSFFKRSYKKAVKKSPELDEIVKRNYKNLLDYESKKVDSVDISADCFAMMMKEIGTFLLGEKDSEVIQDLNYNLGKWIYLIDALDDFDKDKKKKNYNPLVLSYPDILSKAELMGKCGAEISYMFGTILSAIATDAKKLNYSFNHDLVDNILFRGLSLKTKNVMEGKKEKK